MDKVNWWVTAPRDDQGKLDEGECACCGPQTCDGCGAYATLKTGGNPSVSDDWQISSNPGQSLIIESFQFPDGIPKYVPPGGDPDICGSDAFDYTGALPSLGGNPFGEYYDGMYKYPSVFFNVSCGIYRSVFEFYPFGNAMTARFRKGKSPVTGECGWLVSFFLYITTAGLTDTFLTTPEYFFQYSAFPGTVSFSATGTVEFGCDGGYQSGEVTFPAIVTASFGTPYCFEETCY